MIEEVEVIEMEEGVAEEVEEEVDGLCQLVKHFLPVVIHQA